MRVLNVFNELVASGAEMMWCAASPCWREAGVTVDILATGASPGPFAPSLAACGYTLHHLAFSRTPLFFWRFYRLLRRHRYRLVHVHCERASFYYLLVARLAGARVIRSVHAHFPFSGSLGFRRRWQRRIGRWLGAVFVSVSPSVGATEREFFGNPTQVISNWYDSLSLRPPTAGERLSARDALSLPRDGVVIVSVGNCAAVKNHENLLRALARVGDCGDWIYLHAGREEAGQPERRLVGDLGLEGRVRFLGMVGEVRQVLWAADLFVMPSLREGFGVAAVEALATGLPALLTEVPGLNGFREIEGIVWSGSSVVELETSLRRALSLCGGVGEEERRGRHLAVRHRFGMEARVADYVRLYRGLSPVIGEGSR
ncbi:MAG: glycosyltransferase [Magnetococcales bacterium]|nr:glycosyltransferase [Magnetococcales bacterium]